MKKHLSLVNKLVIPLLLTVLLILSSCSQGARGSGQVVQEPTEELVIYVPPNLRFQVNVAIRMFQEEFPHVEVRVRTFTEEHPPPPTAGGDLTAWFDSFILDTRGMDEFNQVLRNGLITHRGPDVVIWYDMDGSVRGRGNAVHLPYSLLTFPDLFKTVGWTDLFTDLEPLFLADSRFDREDYVQGVLDVGLIGERRLFVPLMYHLPILVTTEEALEYFGFDVDFGEELGLHQLMDIIEEFVVENRANSERFLFPTPDRGLRFIYPWLGEPVIDYYLGTVNINKDTFRMAMYWYKVIYEMTTGRSPYTFEHFYRGWNAMGIASGNLLFDFTLGYGSFGSTYTELLPSTEGRCSPGPAATASTFLYKSPVWFPIRRVDGMPMAHPVMSAAIPRSTSNQYNAYEFLRILMGEEWQLTAMHPRDYGMEVYPVNKEALLGAIDSMYRVIDRVNMSEIWRWYLPPETKEEWLEFVWSAEADLNFTHTSLRIVYEYMLPFFRGEQTFEEAFSLLENKLTIYVGE
jgi:ABC-type glycerol-3-phosphate transport system substrate-binding protein